jgi:hypothetical protein
MPTVKFTPSESDVVEANKLWLRRELVRGGNLLFFFCGGVVFAVLGWHFASDFGFDRRAGFGAGVLVWIVGTSLILGIMRLRLPRLVRRDFEERRILRDEVELSWSEDDGVTVKTERGHSRHGWDEFKTWAESKAVIIIFHTNRMFTFIPKRALSESEIAGLRDLLSQRQ